MSGENVAIRVVKETDYGHRPAERGDLLPVTSLEMNVDRSLSHCDSLGIPWTGRGLSEPMLGRTRIHGRITVYQTAETRRLLADAFDPETKSYTVEMVQTDEDGKTFVSRLCGAVIAQAQFVANCGGPILADYQFEASSIEFEGHDGHRPDVPPVGGDTWFCDYCGSRWPWSEYRCTSCAGGRQPERSGQ